MNQIYAKILEKILMIISNCDRSEAKEALISLHMGILNPPLYRFILIFDTWCIEEKKFVFMYLVDI